jgi:Sec-independent protein translocase protein TatA
MENPWIQIIVALLGSGGLGAVVIAVVNNIQLHKRGVSGKEDERREDIVKQRDEALTQAKIAEANERAEEARADAERAKRIQWEEESARLRIALINAGHDPDRKHNPKE